MGKKFYIERLKIEVKIPDNYYLSEEDHEVAEDDLTWWKAKEDFVTPSHVGELAGDKYCCISPCDRNHPPHGYELVPDDSEEIVKKDWKWWGAAKRWVRTDCSIGKVVKDLYTVNGLHGLAKPIVKLPAIPEGFELAKVGERKEAGWMYFSANGDWKIGTFSLVGNILRKGGALTFVKPIKAKLPAIPEGFELVKKDEKIIQHTWKVWHKTSGWNRTVDAGADRMRAEGTSKLIYIKPAKKMTGWMISNAPEGYELVPKSSEELIQKGWLTYVYWEELDENGKQLEWKPSSHHAIGRKNNTTAEKYAKPVAKRKEERKESVIDQKLKPKKQMYKEYVKLQNLKKDHANLAHEYKELLAKHDSLREAEEAQQCALEDLQDEYNGQVCRNEDLQDEYDELESEKESLQDEYDELESEKEELEQERDEIREEYSSALDERAELQQDCEDYSEKLDDVEVVYEETKKAFGEYQTKAKAKIRELEDIADKHYQEAHVNKLKAAAYDTVAGHAAAYDKDRKIYKTEEAKYRNLYVAAVKTINEQEEKEKSQKKRNNALIDTVKSLVKKYSKYARIYKGLCIVSDDSGIDGHFEDEHACVSPYKPEVHGSLNGDQEELLEMLGWKNDGDDMYVYDLRSDEEKKKDADKTKFYEELAILGPVEPLPQPLDYDCPHCETKLIEGVEGEVLSCGNCGEDIGWSDEYGYVLVIDPIEEDLDI